MPFPMPELDEFTTAYIETALWSSTDDDGNALDENWTPEQFSDEALKSIIDDCDSFRAIPQVAGALEAAYALEMLHNNYYPARAGHDFWLTRNGHGAGYWDRGLGIHGDVLTAFAKTFGDCHIFGIIPEGDEHNDEGVLHIG